MTDRTRLSDIAEAAGVSITTVGRVLSGGGRNIRVSRERAEAIRAIALKMNYKPNIAARTLAGSSSKVIGVLIDSHAPGTQVRTLAAIEREAGKHGYRVMVGETHNSYASLADSYRTLRQHGVDGVIIMAHDYPDVSGRLDDHLEVSSRLVFIDQPALDDANFVQIDRGCGVAMAIRALAEKGRKRIAMVTDRNDFVSVRQRIDGYRDGLARYQPRQPELLRRIDIRFDPEGIRNAADDIAASFILPENIDALIAHNDLLGLALIGALNRRSCRVPEDVALIGQDNEIFGACMTPALSSIDESGATTACQAVRMLLDGLNDPETEYIARRVTVKPRLILRETT